MVLLRFNNEILETGLDGSWGGMSLSIADENIAASSMHIYRDFR